MLSAVVITKDEQDRIRACLESIKWVDEIIIMDNGSTDKTLRIAKGYTDKIFPYPEHDFAGIRNESLKHVKGDWVLFADADERVLKPLKEEILTVINNSRYSAYAISRRNIVLGQEVKYGPFWPDWVIRLIRKKDVNQWVGTVHEYVTFTGKLGYTKNSLLHLTHRDIDQMVLKSLAYSKLEAQLRFNAKHPPMNSPRFLKIFFSELFHQGIARKGFFHGAISVIDSLVQTFSLFLTYARLWQLQLPEQPEKTYEKIDRELIRNNFNFE